VTSLALLALALAASDAAASAAAVPAAATPPSPVALRRVLDRVAATVNGEVITSRELVRVAGPVLGDAEQMPPGPERDRARAAALRAALDELVADRLFAQQVKALDLDVSEAQVDAQVAAIKEQNHFTDEQLAQALAAQGMDLAFYRERVRRQLQNFALLQYKVGSRVKVSDQELENYYNTHPQDFVGAEELRVRHIFLPLRENAPPVEVASAQEDGERVLQRLRAGEDFAAVAREVSRGPSAADGGDLGWLRRGTVQRSLEDAIFVLQDGQFSDLVRAGPGLHIVKVEARRRAAGRTFAESKEAIRDLLLNEQGERYRKQYVAELRRDAQIDVRLPELK
jgi:peptidyl-prolyl cis-trans isomerase SurA